MLRQLKPFILSITFIAVFLIASASIPDGYTPTPTNDYGNLKTNLENSVLDKTNVKMKKINSAYQKKSGDLLYAVDADVSVDNRVEKCCITASQSPHGEFFINFAQCENESCKCF